MAKNIASIGQGPFLPHPINKDTIRCHSDQELAEMEASIRDLGQLEEIVLLMDEGQYKILDGNGRYRVLRQLKLTPRYRVWGSRESDGKDPRTWIEGMNLARRHLTDAEKYAAALKCAKMKKGDNQYTSREKEVGPIGPTSMEEAAKAAGTTRTNVKRAKKVAEKGTAELQEALRTEKVSVSDAAAVADETPEIQREAVEMVKEKKVPTLKAAVEEIAPKQPPAKDPVKIAKVFEVAAADIPFCRVPDSHVPTRDKLHQLSLKLAAGLKELPVIVSKNKRPT